jgi:hypothetical protein
MTARAMLLAFLLPLLAGCGDGNPAYTSKAGAGPYDLSDKFLDANGNPLQGWWYVRDSTGGSDGM